MNDQIKPNIDWFTTSLKFWNCSTGATASAADVKLNAVNMLAALKAFQARPKPLSVIYATPEGVARLPKASTSVQEHHFGLTMLRPLSAIAVVQFATVSECQDALEVAIDAGEHAAMLTESVYFDPIEGAREFEKMESQ